MKELGNIINWLIISVLLSFGFFSCDQAPRSESPLEATPREPSVSEKCDLIGYWCPDSGSKLCDPGVFLHVKEKDSTLKTTIGTGAGEELRAEKSDCKCGNSRCSIFGKTKKLITAELIGKERIKVVYSVDFSKGKPIIPFGTILRKY